MLDGKVLFFYDSDDQKHIDECQWAVNCDITKPEAPEIGQACRTVRDCRKLADYKDAVVNYAKVMKTFSNKRTIGFYLANRNSFYGSRDGVVVASKCTEKDFNAAIKLLTKLMEQNISYDGLLAKEKKEALVQKAESRNK